MAISSRLLWFFIVIVVSTLSPATVAQVVFSGSGANPAGIQPFVDNFRTALGTLNPNTPGLLPPTIVKSFDISPIGLTDTAALLFTLTNPNTTATLTNVSFIDTLPPGLVVATPNNLRSTCGNGTITAAPGTDSVSLSGGTAGPGASCTIILGIKPTTTGVKINSVTATAAETGPGNTATATLTVATLSPPIVTMSFGAATIPLSGSTSIGFAITNNANVALTGLTFTDTLPGGLVVATPNGLFRACGGGTLTAVPGSDTISLGGGSMPANSFCVMTLNVTGTTPGVKNNSVSVSSNETGQGNTWNASVTVVAPPTISKSFNTSTLLVGAATTLSFTLTNPNTTTPLTGVGFADNLPAGLRVSSPSGLTGNCGGGTITSTAGSNTVVLTGASLAPSASCTFTVNVTAIASGPQNNLTSTVTSVQGGNGGSATASLVIVAPPAMDIPTLQQWALVVLALLLSLTVAWLALLRRPRSAARND